MVGLLKNEIRFKVISISSHSRDFEYASMSLTRRALIASSPGIAQSLPRVFFMSVVYPVCNFSISVPWLRTAHTAQLQGAPLLQWSRLNKSQKHWLSFQLQGLGIRRLF